MNPLDNLKILIVIPTFNNKSTLRRVVEEALALGLPVLVVNDGSTDGAMDSIANLPVQRIDFRQNNGKGAAIRAAAQWADEQGCTHIITMDADGQHDPGDLSRFVATIQQYPMSLIIGVRDFGMTNTPGSSVFGRKFSNFWIRISCGMQVQDSQSGFRAYPLELFRHVYPRARRYNFEMEILVRAIWAGMAVEQIGINVHYTTETMRASHFRPFVDNARISLTFSRLVTRNLIPWPHKVYFGASAAEEIWQYLFHPIRTIKMLLTEQTSPRQIALASTLGIFMGTLPLIAMHMVAIVFVATRLRLNRLIALNVSHLCAPPLVPALAVEFGYLIRHGRLLTDFNMQTLGHEALQRLWDYLIGSIALAPLLGAAAGLLAYSLALLFRNMQRNLVQAKGVRSGD
jgi:glycosyltransferase involved in cell wall biosynthesis